MIDTRSLVPRLKVLESLAVIRRVASTNLLARHIVNECIENELSLPQAMILAGEQFAGRGRNERSWSSPAGRGIYSTTLLTRAVRELPLVPLSVACQVASFLRDTFAIDARIKWPNDILVADNAGQAPRKIAGILIEARVQDERVFLIIGIGVNVEPVDGGAGSNATSIRETTTRPFTGIDAATLAFVEHLDAQLTLPLDHDAVLEQWRSLTIHQPGDRVHCAIGETTVSGTWVRIDEEGRAVVNTAQGPLAVSAGDLLLSAP